jgi:hypothetical protein
MRIKPVLALIAQAAMTERFINQLYAELGGK